MGAKHGPPQSSSAVALMHLTCEHYARSWGYHTPAIWRNSNHRMPSFLPSGHWETFAALWTYCPQLTTRGPPLCCRCSDPGLPPDWKQPLGRPSHTWLRAVEADLANRTLGLHLPGGRQLFVMTGGGSALWTQQRSSVVCYKRRKLTMPCKKRTYPIITDTGKSNFNNFGTNITWSTVSNALLKSISKHLTLSLSSNNFVTWCIK